MSRQPDQYRLRLLHASLAIAFLMLIAITSSLIPQAYAFNFDNHQICKGWTPQKQPIPANKFDTGETVYLYFKITWTGIEEYEQTWENFKISLIDPSGAEVNTFATTTMHQLIFNPPGCLNSAFLEVLNVTSTTKNGTWKLKWYNGDTVLFTEEFVVGEEQAGPGDGGPGQQTPLGNLGPLIGVIIAIIIALAVVIIFLSRRKKKPPKTAELPPPPPPTPPSAPPPPPPF